MIRLLTFVVLGAALQTAVSPAITAQQEPRAGLWFGVGAGAAVGSFSLEGLLDSRSVGPSGSVFLGGTIAPAVLIGVEASGWRATAADTTRQYGLASVVVAFYPPTPFPMYLKGGLGGSVMREDRSEDGTPAKYEGGGFGLQLGVGIDFRLSGKLVVGGQLQWMSSRQDVKRNQLPLLTGQASINVVQLAATLRYHGAR